MAQPPTANLLSLPGEIRNNIYELVLGGDTYRLRIPRDKLTVFVQVRPHALGLLLLCRKIYTEARLIPFTSNVFSFNVLDTQLTRLSVDQLSSIRHIRIETFRCLGMLNRVFVPMQEYSRKPSGFFDFKCNLPGIKTIELLNVSLPDVPESSVQICACYCATWHIANGTGGSNLYVELEAMFNEQWPEAGIDITSRSVERIEEVV